VDPAALIAIVAATLNLGAAGVLAAVSTAAGWRGTRTFAAIALTAGLYNVTGAVFCSDGLATGTYLLTGRLSYLIAHLQAVLWLVVAYGGPNAQWRLMPRAVRRFAVGSAVFALLVAVTGVHLTDAVDTVAVPWAGVQYHLPVTTVFGDAYGFFVLLQFAATFFALLQRYRHGESGLLLQLVGFTLYFACAVVELAVANRVLEFLSMGDVGMVCVVLPVSVRVMKRFVADAEHLTVLSGRLAGEVRDQQDWRGRAQIALVESERMAAIGRMAAGVGHEINNPLTYLTLSLSEVDAYLRGAGAPPDVVASLEHAMDGATRIQRVAERLRSYSLRQDARAPVDLRDVATAAVRVAGPVIGPDVRLTFDLNAAPRILGDEPRLVQAFQNLLVNASQAVKARQGASSIRVETREGDDGEAILAVHDDGIGVAEAHRERMGEPYFTTRAASGGLGLGLFVTRGIVDAHGGRFEIESSLGEGTSVTLSFPGLRDDTVPAAEPPPRPPVAAPTAPTPPTSAATPSTGRPSVLIIDDEPLVLKMLGAVLRTTWDVTLANDGAEALTHLGTRRFQAIVCDLMMPGMSGIELAEALALTDPDHRRRVVFLTGGAVTEESERFLARPDVRYVVKPITRADLIATIEDARQEADAAI
jgi:signal transduction histidine kinase/ActR/RegA family two-component response regulator